MKAAFLVGINAYKSAPLRGCVPDVRAMLDLLTERFGVPPARTYTLIDKQATRAAILRGLQWLAAQGAEAAFFIYSGHGTRIPDADGDEGRQGSGTTYDQALVPVDYERSGLLLDDDLAEVYSTFPANSRLIIHLDSCFSAKSERSLFARGRGLYDRHVRGRLDRTLPARLLTDDLILESQARREVRRGAVPPRRQLLLSGSRDFETAADAYLGGQYRGAMTFAIERAIARLGPEATYQQVIDEARRRLTQDGFAQIPQLSGPEAWLQRPIYS